MKKIFSFLFTSSSSSNSYSLELKGGQWESYSRCNCNILYLHETWICIKWKCVWKVLSNLYLISVWVFCCILRKINGWGKCQGGETRSSTCHEQFSISFSHNPNIIIAADDDDDFLIHSHVYERVCINILRDSSFIAE